MHLSAKLINKYWRGRDRRGRPLEGSHLSQLTRHKPRPRLPQVVPRCSGVCPCVRAGQRPLPGCRGSRQAPLTSEASGIRIHRRAEPEPQAAPRWPAVSAFPAALDDSVRVELRRHGDDLTEHGVPTSRAGSPRSRAAGTPPLPNERGLFCVLVRRDHCGDSDGVTHAAGRGQLSPNSSSGPGFRGESGSEHAAVQCAGSASGGSGAGSSGGSRCSGARGRGILARDVAS